MNAQEARKLTEASMDTIIVDRYVSSIDSRIKSLAESGKSSMHSPQLGIAKFGPMFHLTAAERKAVRLHYESKGFTWTEHADPDPGHPCSSSYTTLSW